VEERAAAREAAERDALDEKEAQEQVLQRVEERLRQRLEEWSLDAESVARATQLLTRW